MSRDLKQLIEQDAKALGFDAVGFAQPDAIQNAAPNLKAFVEQQHHGSMTWMEETLERRANPEALWPDVKSVIVLVMNYGPEDDPLLALEDTTRGTISVYARHRDYHDVIKGKLKTLASKIVARAGEGEVKVFVDTAPVMEKPLAQAAGLGWQGKHTNLVSQEFGSWLFIGSIFTTLPLASNSAQEDHCGSCSKCLDVCPTNAFPKAYQIDARRCISYLTIENKGAIPLEFRKAIGNRIYGCDDCLAVCPWNKFAKVASEAKLASPPLKTTTELADFLTMNDADFRLRFSGSPVKRIGLSRFLRNCLVAAGNSNLATLLPLVENHCTNTDTVVSETARWAKAELEKL